MSREDLVRTAMTLDDKLDDIKRAQIWSRIDRALDARPAHRLPWRPVLAFAACAAVAAVWFVRRPQPDAAALVAPADATLTAQVGRHTRAELVGPGRLEIVGKAGDATHVRLREGMLVAEFTGGPGRSLHIEAPDAAIDIVGTLFAVEVTGAGTCVSVAHGKVAVTAGDAKLAVATGESWCSTRRSTEPVVEPLSPAMRGRFDRFTAIRVASSEPVSAVAPPAPAAPTAPVAPIAPTAPPTAIAEAAKPTGRVEPARVEPPRIVEKHVEAAVQKPAIAAIVEAEPAVLPPAETPAATPPIAEPRPIAPQPITPQPVAPPPAPAPAPAPARPAPPPVTAETLYQSAEAALTRRDLAGADRALATLVTSFADSALVDQAIYERARIAYQRHAWSDARRQLESLAVRKSSPLAEPGAYLTCRIDVETHDDGAVGCLAAYRRAYPSSPHDLDVLGLLVDIAYRGGGCTHAAGAIRELTTRYPQAKLAQAWHARCEASP